MTPNIQQAPHTPGPFVRTAPSFTVGLNSGASNFSSSWQKLGGFSAKQAVSIKRFQAKESAKAYKATQKEAKTQAALQAKQAKAMASARAKQAREQDRQQVRMTREAEKADRLAARNKAFRQSQPSFLGQFWKGLTGGSNPMGRRGSIGSSSAGNVEMVALLKEIRDILKAQPQQQGNQQATTFAAPNQAASANGYSVANKVPAAGGVSPHLTNVGWLRGFWNGLTGSP